MSNPSQITRRDFLKAAATLGLVPFTYRSPFSQLGPYLQGDDLPNIIIFLFDTMSAPHLSVYGYPRETSPNIDKLANRSTVYHNHHSAGNFTTPSTASLFTSTYPWTHRAFSLSGLISPEVVPNNLFQMLHGSYYQAVFSQNVYANMLLYQFEQYLDRHDALDSYTLIGDTFNDYLFSNDAIPALKSTDQFLFKRQEAHGSLFLSILNDLSVSFRREYYLNKLSDLHPYGLPRISNTNVYYLNEEVMDGVIRMLDELPSPSFSYLHFMAPHEPYVPTSEYLGTFDDGWTPIEKKRHRLAPKVSQERLNERRQTYDEYIANIDAELGRALDHLEETGMLDNSYVIVTSDHGELFERGQHGHSTPLVFEPVIRVPLIISAPGQRERKDVHALTSNVDLLPTLLHIAGIPIPDWPEGQVLPGLGGEETPDRSIFVIEAKKNPAQSPLKKATTTLMKGQHKLVYYQGYKRYSGEYEFYDLENDPEEIHNQYPDHPAAKELRAEHDQKLKEVDQPYLQGD
jgi:arylsulfatase A-like enzyme